MRKILLLMVAVLAIAGLWSGGWLFAAGEVRRAVAGLAPSGGDGATCARLDITGFPFRFDLSCSDATIVTGDVTITVTGIKASLLAYNPTQAVFSARAPVAIADAYSGIQNRIDFAAAEGSARLVTDDVWRGLQGEGWRIGRISIVADSIDWTDTTLAETPLLTAPRAEAHLLDVPESRDADAGTAVLAAYATLTAATAPGLDLKNATASVEAELTGLPDDLRALVADDVTARWQQADGRLRLVAIKGNAGDDFVESSGELGLDSSARLDGQILVRSKGLVERFGAAFPEDWKGLILGSQAPDGSYAQTVTIKAGVIFSGLMPIGIIPPLL